MQKLIKALTLQTAQELIRLAENHRHDEETIQARLPFQPSPNEAADRWQRTSPAPSALELSDKIRSLTRRGKSELMALVWIGEQKIRFNPKIWSDLVSAASTEPDSMKVKYLTRLKLLDLYLRDSVTSIQSYKEELAS